MGRSQQASCLMTIAYLLERPVQLVKSLTHELEYGAVQQHPCKLLSVAYAREVTQQVVSDVRDNTKRTALFSVQQSCDPRQMQLTSRLQARS